LKDVIEIGKKKKPREGKKTLFQLIVFLKRGVY
jgi:hypothetical protein